MALPNTYLGIVFRTFVKSSITQEVHIRVALAKTLLPTANYHLQMEINEARDRAWAAHAEIERLNAGLARSVAGNEELTTQLLAMRAHVAGTCTSKPINLTTQLLAMRTHAEGEGRNFGSSTQNEIAAIHLLTSDM